MKNIFTIVFVLLLAVSGIWAKNVLPEKSIQAADTQSSALKLFTQGNADFSQDTFVPGKIVVKLRDDRMPIAYSINMAKNQPVTQYASLNNKIAANKISEIKKVFPNKNISKTKTDLTKIYYFSFDQSISAKEVAEQIAKDENVLYAEPLSVHRMHETVPNDPRYPEQYHYAPVQAELAWDITQGSSDVIVGIVDSGVDLDHPDLSTQIWINQVEVDGTEGVDDDGNGYIDDYNGWDFVGASSANITPDNDPNQNDGSGHGTHVSGIVGAIANNSIGVVGMAWNVSLMVTKHSPDEASTSIWYGYDGIVYCVDSGADIVNCSWGGGNYSQYAQDIINYAYENDVLMITSAGNDGPGATYEPPDIVPPAYPAAYNHVLAVAATANVDVIDTYSYYGTYVDVAAPGTILSTVPESQGSYDIYSGTSMASPLVAGIAALVKSQHPEFTNDQVSTQIEYTADNIDSIGINMEYVNAGGYGTGRVNAYSAVNSVPGVILRINEYVYDDAVGGDGDGKLESGETISLTLDIANTWGDAENVSVVFEADDYAVTVLDNTIDFGNIAGGQKSVTSADEISFSIAASALPHKFTFTLTISATNSEDQIIEKTIAIEPMVLVVGDLGDNDVSPYYLDVLDEQGVVYDYRQKQYEPLKEGELNDYPIVVWACEWAFPSLDSLDRIYVADYLDNGGKFFLSGQDIGWDMADHTSTSNEYFNSNGASEVFYNDYLKADYVSDISSYSTLIGTADDPIGDGLEFDIFQPGLSSDDQYPDEIAPNSGAVSVFNFTDGVSGALRYEGYYRLVYFAFGGYEAIVDENTRKEVLPRVLNWLSGLSVEMTPLSDTEDESGAYEIDAVVTSTVDAIQSVDLYWDTDGTMPFNRVAMSESAPGMYSASIPAQSDMNVEYFVFAKTGGGTYTPVQVKSFYVGSDTVVPKINMLSQPFASTISSDGPYHFMLSANDNIGIDTTSCYLMYYNDMLDGSLQMNYAGNNQFDGSLTLEGPLELNDSFNYYFVIEDSSSNTNMGSSDTFSLMIDTTEFIDDFETNALKWDTGQSWGLDSRFDKTGDFSISDSPDKDYENNQSNILTYGSSFDLSGFGNAWLDLWVRPSLLKNEDTCFVELSSDDGASWTSVASYSTKLFYFKHYEISIPEFCGLDNENVMLRFRLETDSANVWDGIYIDDLAIWGTFVPATGIENESIAEVPQSYFLKQNYPNPFNPSTKIEFGLKNNSKVKLTIYSVLGQKVKTLVNDELNTGVYRLTWNGSDDLNRQVASGLYLYRLSIEESSGLQREFTSKMLLVR